MFEFTKLQEDHLEMVLQWRVKPFISKYMLSDIEYNLDMQRQWFKDISDDSSYSAWIINYQSVPIGVFNLAAIDYTNRRCNGGYYIGEERYMSLGAMIPPYFYNYVFQEMNFRKIYGEVIASNLNVLKMHQMHGYREVGVYKDHIFKNDQFVDVILIELLSDDWLKQKRYQRYVANFQN